MKFDISAWVYIINCTVKNHNLLAVWIFGPEKNLCHCFLAFTTQHISTAIRCSYVNSVSYIVSNKQSLFMIHHTSNSLLNHTVMHSISYILLNIHGTIILHRSNRIYCILKNIYWTITVWYDIYGKQWPYLVIFSPSVARTISVNSSGSTEHIFTYCRTVDR